MLVALAAAYYVALNAVLIHELVERVQAGPQVSATARFRAQARGPESQESFASCADFAKVDRDICRSEAMVARASEALREQRRERRAAHEERRTAAAR